MNRETIRGRWAILSWEQVYDDGRVVYPMGTALEGFIEYSDFGMFCVIAKADREPFVSGGQWSASDAEKAAAYGSYLTYAGAFDVQGDTVLHHVRHSLFPNWEGGTQRRIAHLDGGVLALTARLEEGSSEARTATLRWRRAE
ncbi:lipocalin-like domain-containing protein [Pseudomonas panipatensis]|uniref:Lipocalin-like domain-containing protein n=1 Tax=Pseudomonas panipatensis TaxID=428992 RepID=A0A1G8I425_9PSED|nr:lipocalin-like domain-containing protein [Pseudomonas panipatensis]SDI13725.1 Lipocalin-like domain-containing protein [Pseudomonas panipatensis]SMP76157.1 Lipocalin-like domain-containing protein [Pseudomonas panipatensis]